MLKLFRWFAKNELYENLFYLGLLSANIGILTALGFTFFLIMFGASLFVVSLLVHPDWQ